MPEPQPIAESDFLRLFLRHEEALRAFARVLLPTWDSVDEVMQESSVVMWKKLGQLDSANGFLPWAKVIVRFEALRLRREHARDRHVFSGEVFELLANEAAEVSEAQWERERAALRDCLAQFTLPHRELVLAPYAGAGRVTRLAEQSGRSVNSLYKLLGRLREKLVRCVEAKLAQETFVMNSPESSSARARWRELMDGHLLGELSAGESRELEAALAAHREAREDFRLRCNVDAALRKEAAVLGQGSAAEAPSSKRTPAAAGGFSWLSWRPLTAAAAGLVSGLFSASMVWAYAVPLTRGTIEQVVTVFADGFEDAQMRPERGFPKPLPMNGLVIYPHRSVRSRG